MRNSHQVTKIESHATSTEGIVKSVYHDMFAVVEEPMKKENGKVSETRTDKYLQEKNNPISDSEHDDLTRVPHAKVRFQPNINKFNDIHNFNQLKT